MALYYYVVPQTGGTGPFKSSSLIANSPEVRDMAEVWLFGVSGTTYTGDVTTTATSSLDVSAVVVTPVAVTTMATSSLTVAIATPVIAAWGFERPGTTFTDVVGGRIATISGTAALTTGHASTGSLYNPSGSPSGSGATVPETGLEPSASVGVSAWFASLYTGASYNTAVSKSRTGDSDSYAIYSNFASDKPAFVVTTTSGFFTAVSPTSIADGTWHNVAGSYDGQYVRLYIDYVEVAATAATGDLVYDANGLGILTSTAFPTERVDAQIDDVRIWGSAPSQAEIAAAGPVPVIDPPITFTATVTTSATSSLTVDAAIVTPVAVSTTATSSLEVSAIVIGAAGVVTLATSTLTVEASISREGEVTTSATSSLTVTAEIIEAYEPICGFIVMSDTPLRYVTVSTVVRHVVVEPAAATHVVVDDAPLRHLVVAKC